MKASYEAPVPPFAEITAELEPGRVFTIRRMPTTGQLQAWSAQVTGSVYIGEGTFTHTAGHHSEIYIVGGIIMPVTGERVDLVAPIKKARAVTQALIGAEDVGWTYGQMARKINAWLNIFQLSEQSMRGLVKHWHYQYCKAGVYEYCAQFDMSAAYWQVVRKVESPRLRLVNGRIEYQALGKEQRTRWTKLMKVFAGKEHKKLRLMLVGVNAAGWKPEEGDFIESSDIRQYSGGKPMPRTNLTGALQPLAMLAVRCTFELCQIQAEMSRAVYANADCVITEGDAEPAYWQECGVEYRKQAEGVSIIRQMGSYMVGPKMTAPYHLDNKHNIMDSMSAKRIEMPHIHRQVFCGE